MKKMTDRELTDRISQVFDDFEDPSAGYGWQQLRKKYPENNRRPVLLWWGATAAAIFLVVCGLWLTNLDINTKHQKTTNKQTDRGASSNEPQQALRAELHDPTSETHLGVNSSSGSFNNPASDKSVLRQAVVSKGPLNPAPSDIVQKTTNLLNPAFSQILLIENSIHKDPLILLPESHNPSDLKHSVTGRDSLVDATAKLLALAESDPAINKHTRPVKDLPSASQKTDSKNLTFSFFAGSYFNYSLGSDTELNFGGGFTSDIKLSNNLKLSTGLALANNSLTYKNGVPSTRKENVVYNSVPSFGSQVNNNNLTTITKYDASLLVLDIPINIKYLLIPKDNKLYMSAGLSSGTYLSEMYSVNYRNYSVAGAYISQSQGAEVKKQLQAFDFARTLNISFGYSANLGKTQNISIEPFLKYPLGGLGSEDLKFGSTGINLKLNFSQFKKR